MWLKSKFFGSLYNHIHLCMQRENLHVFQTYLVDSRKKTIFLHTFSSNLVYHFQIHPLQKNTVSLSNFQTRKLVEITLFTQLILPPLKINKNFTSKKTHN